MANAKRFTALIVDDDSTNVANNVKHLSKNGFQTRIANNGQEALQLFLSGITFDLVIMDLEMPIMDGFQATKEIRALGIGTLIIGMADASPSQSKIREFIHAGLDDYYAKPMNMTKLAAIVSRHFS